MISNKQENFFTKPPFPCKSIFFDINPIFPKYNRLRHYRINSAGPLSSPPQECAPVSISFLLSRIKSALSLSLFFLAVFCSAALISQKESPARPLSIALILENGASDHGAADMLRDALRTAAGNQTDLFRKAASEHDLVIVAEGRLHEILRDNAAAFPKTMFGCIDTGVRNRNIMSVTFEDNEPAYIAGAAAAKLLAPGTKIGWLQAEKTPMLNNMYKAFVDGTQLSSPGTKTLQVSTGFNKPLAEADALRSLEEKGCGIVVVAGGYGQRGVWNAAGTTRALLVGMDQDPAGSRPRALLHHQTLRQGSH